MNWKIIGVPVSSQWKPSGHIYPIQVGQFGLSYFSKWIESKKNNQTNSDKSNNFTVDGNLKKFVYHENQLSSVKSIQNGFQFKFTGKILYHEIIILTTKNKIFLALKLSGLYNFSFKSLKIKIKIL